MEVKEAVAVAKKYLADLFADEKIANLGLEEVQFDPDRGAWLITLGFSRAWETAGVLSLAPPPRTLKVVEVNDSDKRILGVKHRLTVAL